MFGVMREFLKKMKEDQIPLSDNIRSSIFKSLGKFQNVDEAKKFTQDMDQIYNSSKPVDLSFYNTSIHQFTKNKRFNNILQLLEEVVSRTGITTKYRQFRVEGVNTCKKI